MADSNLFCLLISAPALFSGFRGLLIAALVSLLFLLLLRFTAPVMVWVLIIGLLGAGAYGKRSPRLVFRLIIELLESLRLI